MGVHFIRHPCLTRTVRVRPPGTKKAGLCLFVVAEVWRGLSKCGRWGRRVLAPTLCDRHRASLHVYERSVGFASCETLGKHYHASLRLRSFGSARPCADSVRPLSCILARRACSVGFASVPRQPFGLPHLCIDSHLCRCIVQRLCVAVFMHPCITALCGCLYASLHNGLVRLTLSIHA